MVTIKFIFEDGSEDRQIEIDSGHTVLEAALLNDIKLNHNCGGVCACSTCLLYTSPSPRDRTRSRMPSSA